MAILGWDQVAAVAIWAGWPPGPAVIAVAITQPESGRNATIVQQGEPYATTGWGLWQITPGDSVPQFGVNEQMLDPRNNAEAGHAKWRDAGGFSPWTTYENGLERPYIGQAEAAVGKVAHLSRKALEQLVAEARTGGGTPGLTATAADDWAPRVAHTARHHHVAARHLMGYAEGISGLKPRFTRPTVTVPAPGPLLWRPGEGLPHA